MTTMEGWIYQPLGEIASLVKGISYSSSDYCGPDEGAIFLTIKCVSKAGGFKKEGIKYYRGPIREQEILKIGDLLIANTDLTRDGDIVGCPVYVPDLGTELVTMSMDLSKLVIDPEKVDGKFLYFKLMTEPVRRFMQDHASGSTVLHLQTKAVPNLNLLIPADKEEQTQIATILSTLDRAIEQTEAIITKQQRIKAGLMQDLLTKGIDEHGVIRSEATHQFKDSPLGRIPVEWEVAPAHTLCEAVIDCKNRTPPESKEGHPVIRTPNVRDGKFVESGLAMTDAKSYEIWTARGKPRSGDVVITREAPFGEACLIPDNITAPCLGQRMMMYQTDPQKLRSDFMVFAIYSERVQQRLLELAGGSTVGHIRVGDIRNLSIPHPKDVDEQENIATTLIGIEQVIATLTSNMKKLRLTKAGLMHDLLTGTVRVPMP